MLTLLIILVSLFSIHGAQCGYTEPDVYDLLLSLENKLEIQVAKIKVLEETVSEQEKKIADLSEEVASQKNDKENIANEFKELKLKSVKQDRTIKRLVRYFRKTNMEVNGDVIKTKDHTKISGIQNVGNPVGNKNTEKVKLLNKAVDGKKRFVLDTVQTVAFEATIAAVKHVHHNNIHDMIVFDDVSLNVGNGYHYGNGTFIAPVGGIYIFSTSVSMHGASSQDPNMQVVLEKNNVEIAGAFAYNRGPYEHSSVSAAMELKAGDVVAVTVERHNDISFYGDRLTSFMGFLLFPY